MAEVPSITTARSVAIQRLNEATILTIWEEYKQRMHWRNMPWKFRIAWLHIILMLLGILWIVLFEAPASAATYYLSSSGSDANPGTSGSPFLTLFGSHPTPYACGDTIIVPTDVAVVGDGNAPQMPCASPITVQSAKLAQFNPIGYRTDPVRDAGKYGKLKFTNQGIALQPSVWSFNPYGNWQLVSFNTSTNIVTLGSTFVFVPMANGTQVEFEPYAQGSINTPSLVPPSGISFLTHYYVIGCSVSPACGLQGSTFQLSLTSGGSPISLGTCGPPGCFNTVTSDPAGACSPDGQGQWNSTNNNYFQCSTNWAAASQNASNIRIGIPVAASTVTSRLTLAHSYGLSLANGMPVGFSSSGYNSPQGVVPTPLVLGAPYYVVNLSGSSFQVALTPGGAPITLTGQGTGMVNISSFDEPSNWHFRGIEFAPDGTHVPFTFLVLGNAGEVSPAGMTSNNEVDRCYMHDNPPTQAIVHAIYDNGGSASYHDSWIIGANLSEAQAIGWVGSPGPTSIINNFLEATSEVTIGGGAWSAWGGANANKLFVGNYFYKPPIWKISVGNVPASGACLYDATDPTHAGGEFYTDASAVKNYQCPPNGIWGTFGATLPPYGAGCSTAQLCIKDMTEHKNGRYFSYIGNLYNYSISQDQSGQVFNNSVEWGSGPGAANDHITIMNNAAFHSFTWNTRTSQCTPTIGACPVAPGVHTTINNLMVVDGLACGTAMAPTCPNYNQPQMGTTANDDNRPNYFTDDYWNHNTFWFPDSYSFGTIPLIAKNPSSAGACPPYVPLPIVRLFWLNTLTAGDVTTPCNAGHSGITDVFDGSGFANNAFRNSNPGYWPYTNANVGATNTWAGIGTGWPTTNAGMGFNSGTTGLISDDYRLLVTSPYSAANNTATQLAPDGTDLGVDIDAINMATIGAAAGTPPLDQKSGLHIDIGSTKAVAKLTSPGGACTWTVYNTAVRNLFGGGNIVASVADTAGTAIRDGARVEIPVTGLTASTHYWYKMVCGSAIMVGEFLSHAAGSATLTFGESWSVATAMKACDDKALTVSCTSFSAALNVAVPVNAGAIRYTAVSMRVAP